MSACLSHDQLVDLLAERTGEAERAGLETHIEDCDACRNALLLLAGDGAPVDWRSESASAMTVPGEEFLLSLKRLVKEHGESIDEARPPIVPGFELLEEIGRGSAGVVYKARQLGLDRIVAIKFVHDAGLSAADRSRAIRGARIIAHLRHPNIVQILEVGVRDGRLYGIFEYLEGGSLSRLMKGRTFTPREAAELVRSLADALDAVHRQGIIHRDLKPANVLLTQSDGTMHDRPSSFVIHHSPKIADFSLARSALPGSDVTRTGEILGTPSYMAPEQATGDALGPAVDIHAAGAILYELLIGEPPYRGSHTLETLHKVVHEEPLPPVLLRKDVPRDLERICLKCLAKEPSRRYASAAELRDDLDRFLQGTPIQAGPVSSGASWNRQGNRAVAVLSLLMALVCVGALSAMFLQHRQFDRREIEQIKARIEAEQAATERISHSETARYETSLELARYQLQANEPAGARKTLNQWLPREDETDDHRDARWHELWRKVGKP